MRHGGDILSYQNKYNGKIIDFSSNINPLGFPEAVKYIFDDVINNVASYPDINYRNLKREISIYIGCCEDEVIAGNGAVEIINNVSILFSRVLAAIPCFSEYIERPRVLGKEIIKIPLFEDFELDLQSLGKNIRKDDLIILGNPNNPTGKRINRNTLIEIHGMIEECGAFLLLDEAFYEFCSEDYDSIELFRGSKNICVIRAATKFFALPGIRLGYAFTSREFSEKYNSVALPWSINVSADIAAKKIFRDNKFITRSKKYIEWQRKYLITEIEKIKYLNAYATDCNFILIKLLKGTEDELLDFLIKKGILIRKASSFEGLDKSYVRIAVKSERDNEYLINMLKEFDEFI